MTHSTISTQPRQRRSGFGYNYECPWLAQPEPWLQPNWTSRDRPENCCLTVPIQPKSAWEDLERRMAKIPQIQVCKACHIIPNKTQGCNRCQRCFNQVLSKRSEYLCVWYFSFSFNTFATNPVFCHVIGGIECRLMREINLNNFSISLQCVKCEGVWIHSVMFTKNERYRVRSDNLEIWSVKMLEWINFSPKLGYNLQKIWSWILVIAKISLLIL